MGQRAALRGGEDQRDDAAIGQFEGRDVEAHVGVVATRGDTQPVRCRYPSENALSAGPTPESTGSVVQLGGRCR